MGNRLAIVKRETKETNISLELNIDGSGKWEMNTGLRMFDHLLSQLSQHGVFDLKISATGNDQHLLVEDDFYDTGIHDAVLFFSPTIVRNASWRLSVPVLAYNSDCVPIARISPPCINAIRSHKASASVM